MRFVLGFLYRHAPCFHLSLNDRFEIDTRHALFIRGPWFGWSEWAAYWSPEDAIFDRPRPLVGQAVSPC